MMQYAGAFRGANSVYFNGYNNNQFNSSDYNTNNDTDCYSNININNNNSNNNNNNNNNINNNSNNNINQTEDVNASGLYFRNLAYNCRKLKRSKLINDMDVTDGGNITIKFNNGSLQMITRREDLIGMFPAFQGFLFC